MANVSRPPLRLPSPNDGTCARFAPASLEAAGRSLHLAVDREVTDVAAVRHGHRDSAALAATAVVVAAAAAGRCMSPAVERLVKVPSWAVVTVTLPESSSRWNTTVPGNPPGWLPAGAPTQRSDPVTGATRAA
jgi:hypothetical protein